MVLVRKMRSEDVEEASKVICDAMRDSWKRYEKGYYPKRALEFDISTNSPQRLREKLAIPEKLLFVAEENETIVGVAFGEVIGESGLARLGWIGVHPKHQRRGIGKALLNEFVENCRQKRCHKVTLYTLPVLIPAMNLYLKCGFVPEAYLRREWWKADFVRMSLWLESA
ncbi:MAG: GNAT family N-acetyltransferase [Candidatus Bathyarchaeia archaeon]